MTECSRRRRRRQMVHTKELPQRARYYQSVGDGVALSKGGHYTNLKEQYIIFLCPMDIFGGGFPVYHFENRARENFNISLNDYTFKNFLSFAPNPLRLGNAPTSWSHHSPCRIYYI